MSSCSEVLAVESLDKPLTVFREERFPHDSADGLFYSLGPPRALVLTINGIFSKKLHSFAFRPRFEHVFLS